MGFTVSALSFVGPKMKWMRQLPNDMGIEIFWDWGSEAYWEGILPVLLAERTGKFSIHGPMTCIDISLPGDENRLFDLFKRPFNLYHRHNAQFYVLHTNGALAAQMSEREMRERRALARERICKFQRICLEEGVQLVVENIGRSSTDACLFSQEQFLELFTLMPELHCLLDTGHALLSDMDIGYVQRTLRERIFAYHIHDNDGRSDQHLRMRAGIYDWPEFIKNYRQFTPGAEIVMEYGDLPNPAVYVEDRDWIERFQ